MRAFQPVSPRFLIIFDWLSYFILIRPDRSKQETICSPQPRKGCKITPFIYAYPGELLDIALALSQGNI
jgi:hypothetical protein